MSLIRDLKLFWKKGVEPVKKEEIIPEAKIDGSYSPVDWLTKTNEVGSYGSLKEIATKSKNPVLIRTIKSKDMIDLYTRKLYFYLFDTEKNIKSIKDNIFDINDDVYDPQFVIMEETPDDISGFVNQEYITKYMINRFTDQNIQSKIECRRFLNIFKKYTQGPVQVINNLGIHISIHSKDNWITSFTDYLKTMDKRAELIAIGLNPNDLYTDNKMNGGLVTIAMIESLDYDLHSMMTSLAKFHFVVKDDEYLSQNLFIYEFDINNLLKLKQLVMEKILSNPDKMNQINKDLDSILRLAGSL